jgi:hypothetical protein
VKGPGVGESYGDVENDHAQQEELENV